MNKIFKENIYVVLSIVVALIVLVFLLVGNERKDSNIIDDLKDKTDITVGENNESVDNEPEKVVPVQSALEKAGIAIDKGDKAYLAQNYGQAATYYQQAIDYGRKEMGYVRLSRLYTATGEIEKALDYLDKAIELNPTSTDHQVSKLALMDEKTEATFSELKSVYLEGLEKVNSTTKINLVTTFARMAENNQQYQDAIGAWEEAKTLYPDRADIYQAEIDRLKSL